jgi:hypothetical protein
MLKTIYQDFKVNSSVYGILFGSVLETGGTRERSWLRHYATSRKVAGSSPDEVNFFQFI